MRDRTCLLSAMLFATAVAYCQGNEAPPATSFTLPCVTSWVGNTFGGGAGQWVQNMIVHMNVEPDGTCRTWSHWDEAGNKFGIYKDGRCIGNKDTGANSFKVKDRQGRQWEIQIEYTEPKYQEYEFIPKGITCDGKAVVFPGLHEPTALALANDGALMIADSGASPRQQVLFYDIRDISKPRLTREFGERGGIAAGTPGAVAPLKFWGIRGIGMDREGSIYVGLSEQGVIIRKLSPEGELAWEIFDHFFTDVACVDPASDGLDVYGVQEHYRMDYSQSAGKEAKWVGYSLMRHRYPHDPRGLMFVKQAGEHGLTSPQIAWIGGKKFMFVGGMYASNFINIFRFEGEVAIPAGVIMQWTGQIYRSEQVWPPHRPKETFIWRDVNGDGDYQKEEYFPNTDKVKPGPFWVDARGDIWMACGFFKYECEGLDGKGNPIYSADKINAMATPKGMKNVVRANYDVASDTLVAAEDAGTLSKMGRVFIYKGFEAGNAQAVSFMPGAGENARCLATAGDYVFTGGWRKNARVWVNRKSDGACVGVLEPGPEVGGPEKTGWMDLLTGITAFKRKNGEYLVFAEDDARGKSVLYRWKP